MTKTYTYASKWEDEGVPDCDMVGIKHNDHDKTPTNADCIKYLYNYEELEDPKIPSHRQWGQNMSTSQTY